MWGGAPWGGVPWGGLLSLNMPSHGHAFGAGAAAGRLLARQMIQAMMAQQAQRSAMDNLSRRQRAAFLLESTQHGIRMQMVREMEQRIYTQDVDDLFLVLSV